MFRAYTVPPDDEQISAWHVEAINLQ
jgi:hypothetical protein